jgi:hypothetical protein
MASDPAVAAEFIKQARSELGEAVEKIEHCLNQLGEIDVWWRPFTEANAIGNVVLHLCGNLRQWVISGVGGIPDVRKRREEFAERGAMIKKAELLSRLKRTVAEADEALARCTPDNLLRVRHVQHYDVTGLQAAFTSISHFVGHTHQIVYITRLRLGEKYEFQGLTAADE